MDDGDIRGFKMTRFITALMVVFLFTPVVYADEALTLAEIPKDRSYESITSVLDFTVENRGFEKVVFKMPVGWNPGDIDSDASFYSGKGYPVMESGLWRVYGLPYDRTSYLGAYEAIPFLTGKVWTGQGYTHRYGNITNVDTGEVSTGWMIYPNERLVVHIELNMEIPDSLQRFDPTLLETEYKYLRVTKWEQEFILKTPEQGFITAPWVIKNGKLVLANPAVYCDDNDPNCPGTVYWEDLTIEDEEIEAPEWTEWFGFKNSLAASLTTTPTPTRTELIEVEADDVQEMETTIPVWKITNLPAQEPEIRYAYEWRRDGKVDGGITFDTAAKSDIPAWYQWF